MAKHLIWIDPINRDAHFLKLISGIISTCNTHNLEIFTTQRLGMELNNEINFQPFFKDIWTLKTGKISLNLRMKLIAQYISGFQAITSTVDSSSLVLYSSGMSLPELEYFGIQRIKRRASKTILLVHNLEDSQSVLTRLSKWRTSNLLRAFDGWIFLSNHMREEALSRLEIQPEKTHVMLHPHFEPMLKGIEPCQQLGSELQEFAKGRLVIAYVSRADQDHGIDIFYQLIQVLSQKSLPVCGIVIGRLGKNWSHEKNQTEIRLRNLSKQILLTKLGSYTYAELRSVLTSADFVFAPYRKISQSGAIALALGEQVPVIASAVGANREMIKYGLNGLLFDIHNPDSIFEDISMIYKNCQTVRQRFPASSLFNDHLNPMKNVQTMLDWLKT